MADSTAPTKQLTLVKQRCKQTGIVLVQPAADPRIVAKEHIAGAHTGIFATMLQRPLNRHVHRGGKLSVVLSDEDEIADFVGYCRAEVIAIRDHDRTRHALQRISHVLSNGGQTMADDLVG